MDERRESEGWSWLVGLVAGVALLALLVAAYEIGYSRGRGPAGAASEPAAAPAPADQQGSGEQAASGPGKQVFTESCGSCHVVSAAGTKGAVGPNLDQLKPGTEQVLAALKNGGTGSGAMPVNIVTGEEAEQVADFVAAATGGK